MMAYLSTVDLVGFWLGIFLTFCILSFLYKDNPIYKFAEHVFIGVSIGYVVTKQYYDTLRPKLIDNLVEGRLWYLLGLALSLMLLAKLWRRWGWVGRWPIAFVVAFYAGLQVNGMAQGDLGKQLDRAMDPVSAFKVNVNDADVDRDELATVPGISPAVADVVIANRPIEKLSDIGELPGLTELQRQGLADERGTLKGLDAQATVGVAHEVYWFGTLSQILLLLGTIAALVYFYFSVPQKGVVGKVSRVGVWVLMIGFGASFGYTVQGRIALAIGRARDVMGRDKDAHLAEQISGPTVALISIAVIVLFLVIWELQRRSGGAGSTEGQG